MYYRRRLLSFLLAVGAVAGYASGFAHLRHLHQAGGPRWGCPREAPAAQPSAQPTAPPVTPASASPG
jgi:hypothetical protein